MFVVFHFPSFALAGSFASEREAKAYAGKLNHERRPLGSYGYSTAEHYHANLAPQEPS